jgi:hypothetical protein
MRHTERDNRSGTVTPEQAASHDCAAQSALTPSGRQHAQQIGAAIGALQLPIAAVHTARLCRTEETGQLLNVAPVTDDDRLDASSTWINRGGAPAEQRATLQVLSEPPPAGTDIVLVSRHLGSSDRQKVVDVVLVCHDRGRTSVAEARTAGSPATTQHRQLSHIRPKGTQRPRLQRRP